MAHLCAQDSQDVAGAEGCLDIPVNHIAQQQSTMVSERGQRFATPALMNEMNGGVAWSWRAFTVLLVYRPPSNDAEIWEAPGEHRARRELGDLPEAKPKALLSWARPSSTMTRNLAASMSAQIHGFWAEALCCSPKRSGHDESPGGNWRGCSLHPASDRGGLTMKSTA